MRLTELVAAAIFENEARLDARALGVQERWEDQRSDIRNLYLKDAEAALDALKAAGFDLQPGWRPLQGAPDNADRRCVLYFPEEGEMRIGRLDEVDGSATGAVGQASHWRPLPDPPHAEKPCQLDKRS